MDYFKLHERLNKEQFTAEFENRIKNITELKAFCKNTLPDIVRKFDGKALNTRLLKAISNSLPRKEFWVHDDYFSRYRILIKVRNERCYYSEYEQACLVVVFNDHHLRIDAEATLAYNTFSSLDEKIADYSEAISEYENMMEIARELERAINEWNETNYYFRGNITLPSLH